MNKISLLAVLLAFLTPGFVGAEVEIGGQKFGGFLDFCVRSRYQIQYGVSISDKPMACQELQVRHLNSGIYVGTWFSQGLTAPKDSRYEQDFYGGKGGTAWDRINYELQVQYIRLTGVGPLAEFAVRLDDESGFYWKGSYLLGLKANSPNGGFLTRAGFVKTFSVPLWSGYEQKIRPDVYFGGSVGGAVGVPSGVTHSGAKVGFPIELGRKNLVLTPTVGGQYTRKKFRGEGKGKIAPDNPVWGELSLKFSW
jgi:hypothetical protein